MDRCGQQDIGFHSLTDRIDTSTVSSKLVFHIMGSLAEIERSLIVERTKAGMKAAKRRGKHAGWPRVFSDEQISHAKAAITSGETISRMAWVLKVNSKTLTRALNNDGVHYA